MSTINPEHDSLLARPMKHKITPRFFPVYEKFKIIKRPVVPLDNRRLEMAAWPKRPVEKYTPPDIPSTILSRRVLEASLTPRLDHLSRPFVRTLTAQRAEKQNVLGVGFFNNMTDRIAMSLDTIYYHNVKSLMNIAAERRKSTKSLPIKKAKCFADHGDKERLLVLSTPKKLHPPRQLPFRKRKNLEDFIDYIIKLAVPKWVYKRPSKDSMIKKNFVSVAAKTCVARERTKELAHNVPWKMVAPYVYTGKVPRAALKATMTPRLEVLAAARARASAPESDLKENPYDINPYALKYKATPRILELAKPVER